MEDSIMPVIPESRQYRVKVVRKLFWYVLIKAPNGETTFSSETFFKKANAIRAAKQFTKQINNTGVNLES